MCGGGGDTQTVTTIEGLPDEAKKYLYGQDGILSRAQNISMDPMAPPDYNIAARTGLQDQAVNMATSGVGSYLPFIQQGVDTTVGGMGTMLAGAGSAMNAYGNALPYQGAAAGQFGAASGTASGAAGAYNPNSYQNYMNPYEDAVMDRVESDIARQGAMQEDIIRAQAVGQGAFGGSRTAVAERENARNTQNAQADAAANLRSQGYTTAQGMAMQNFEQQQQRQGAVAGSLANIGQGMGQLGTNYGQLGMQMSQQLGQTGQGIAGLGSQFANFGGMMQDFGNQDINTISSLGGQQQQQNQAWLDANRQNQYQRQMMPYQQLGFLSDIFSGSPTGTNSMMQSTQPAPSFLSQIGGLGMGLYGLSNAGVFGG